MPKDKAEPGGRPRPRAEPRGRADAPKLGVYLARHAFFPTGAGVAGAPRARNLGVLVTAFARAPPVSIEERIYEATPHAILQVIKETGRERRRCW